MVDAVALEKSRVWQMFFDTAEYRRRHLEQVREQLRREIAEYENRQLIELCKSYWEFNNGRPRVTRSIGEM